MNWVGQKVHSGFSIRCSGKIWVNFFVNFFLFTQYFLPPNLTTFSGSLCPGRYFTFSWSLFMMSVSFLPLTVSSKTHILTVEANFWSFLTLLPIIFATAEPLQKKRWKRKWLKNNIKCKRLPWWFAGKESTCQFRRCRFKSWNWKISWRRKWQHTPVFLPRKSHGWRSLAGYRLPSTGSQKSRKPLGD